MPQAAMEILRGPQAESTAALDSAAVDSQGPPGFWSSNPDHWAFWSRHAIHALPLFFCDATVLRDLIREELAITVASHGGAPPWAMPAHLTRGGAMHNPATSAVSATHLGEGLPGTSLRGPGRGRSRLIMKTRDDSPRVLAPVLLDTLSPLDLADPAACQRLGDLNDPVLRKQQGIAVEQTSSMAPRYTATSEPSGPRRPIRIEAGPSIGQKPLRR